MSPRHSIKTGFVNTLLLISAIALVACAGSNMDPEKLGMRNGQAGQLGGEKNFANLINNYAQGKPATVPWAAYWWAYTENGIASGKHTGGQSPAGKYDAARGNAGGKAQDWEIKYHGAGVKDVQGWWGHCNGWCAAAALFPEPREPKKTNGIVFGIADQKALLSEAGMYANYDFYGNRAERRLFPNGADLDLAMDDVVPNQFFLLVTNYMGMNKKPLLFDRFTGDQVWNQPFAGYKFEYPKPEDYKGAAPSNPNVYRINLTSTIWWAEDAVPANVITDEFNWEPRISPESSGGATVNGGHYSSRVLKLEVWLDGPVVFDANGKITSSGNVIVTRHPRNNNFVVGGQWLNGSIYSDGHPDYIWVPTSIPRITEETTPTGEINEEANPYVDIDWVAKYILTGTDDPSMTPVPVPTAPSPRPRPSGSPDPAPTSTGPTPIPTPTVTSTGRPNPFPTFTVPPIPIPNPFPTSTGGPTRTPRPQPF
jgi:hypothetical protein